MPLVSVVIPTYNRCNYINRSVESILNQTFFDFELIIIDDGSRDDTSRVLSSIKDPRVRYYQNKYNRGVVYTRNMAMNLAKGELLAVNDVDDVSHPQRLEKQVNFFSSNPDYWAVGTHARRIKESGEFDFWKHPTKSSEIKSHLLWGSALIHSSVMFNLKHLRSKGLFYSSIFEVAEDYDLFERIARHGLIANLDEVLIDYYVLESGLTLSKGDLMKKSSFSIFLRQINSLGIHLTDVEERIFFKLYKYNFKFSLAEIFVLIKVSENMISANNEKNIYHHCTFNYLLAKRIFEANYHSLETKSLKYYQSSLLRLYYYPDAYIRVKKRIKSLLR